LSKRDGDVDASRPERFEALDRRFEPDRLVDFSVRLASRLDSPPSIT
jgi:hypothetical protein